MFRAFLFCLVVAGPVKATTTFVDINFDRSSWEAGLTGIVTDTFDSEIAQSTTLNLGSGIQSVASGAIGSPNHLVTAGRFNTTLRPSGSGSDGFTTIVWTLPYAVTAFGADFFSIAGSRQVGPEGTFDAGSEHFDLRTLFGNLGGVDQGFFGIKSTVPFDTISFTAPGTGTNDNFTIDNVAFAVPEPSTGLLLLGGLFFSVARSRRRERPVRFPGKFAGLIMLLSVGLFPLNTAEAVVVVSNLSGADNGNASPQSTFWIGQAFTTDNATYALDSVSLQGANSSGGSQVFLYSDSGSLPSAQLGSFSTTGFGTASGTYSLPVQAAVTLNPTTTYWVVFAPNDFNFGLWRITTTTGNQSGPGDIPDLQAFSGNGGASFTATNFTDNLKLEIAATPIPEPATVPLLAMGTVAFLHRRRRRQA
ncbi:MAG: PEP-CTERM sorting domain-containing protein [Verrucomicrobiae bacterium]|nr:PEP-CTERM sorting domain-containing protein [Verrucomicrobiae bacterium]